VRSPGPNESQLTTGCEPSAVPTPVERTDPDGVDYGRVMQVTFVATIVVGAPLVAALSTLVALPTWGARAAFAVRVGAGVWFCTAVAVFAYERRRAGARAGPGSGDG
jgi:hypothetical protein